MRDKENKSDMFSIALSPCNSSIWLDFSGPLTFGDRSLPPDLDNKGVLTKKQKLIN